MDRKATGWIPDYPDFRDYRMDEINQKLMMTVQDIQISNDNDSQNSLEELFELLNSIKNELKEPSKDKLASKFEKFEKKRSKGLKLVNAKALKEEIFLAPGCTGQEVYNLQQKLFKFKDYRQKFGDYWKIQIDKSEEAALNSEYIEYGYFGKITEEAVKLLKRIFGILIVSDENIERVGSDESVDSVVDQVTLYTLNQVLEILESPETKKTFEDEDTEKIIYKLGMFDPEIKEIQKKLNKLGYLKNLGENNGAIRGLFDYLTQDAVQEFQTQNDLRLDSTYGLVCKKTRESLNKLCKNYDSYSQKIDVGEKVQELKNIQNLLRELGEFDGQVTGYFGSQTKAVITSFKAKYRLAEDGDNFKKTLEVLRDLVTLKKQERREVLPVSSAIPISLYEAIFRVFEISEFQAEEFVSEKELQAPTNTNREKGLQPSTDTNNCDIANHQSALKRSINMIVKLIAQIISPLAQHINLEKAVRDVLEKLDQWFDKSEYVNEIRKKNNPQENQQLITNPAKYESSQQKLREKSSIFSQTEQEINLFKDWELNPVSSYIALSAILNFKKALINIYQIISDQGDKHEDRKKRLASSLKKIDDIFKFIKDLNIIIENVESSLSYNPYIQEGNHLKNQHKNLRTVIQILPELPDKLKYLDKSPEFQSDLLLPIEGNLQKSIREKQEDCKKVTVYLLMPEFVDLSFWCSPIEDQGSLDSCTAHAGVALMEYFEKRSFDRYVDASRLFLYKATRNLMHRQGDVGASLRQTMQAMALFGVPPEGYWPYIEDKFDEEPTPFCYSFGQSYQALKYFRLNPSGTTEYILLLRIKAALAAGFPCAFGFTMYYSIEDLNPSGYIAYPVKNDKVKGGHAVVAVGYDDHKVIDNADGSRRSQGALLIRNSWGTDWGQGGYGWLPYDYVLEGLTNDWWSLLKSKWFETGHFGLGANDWASDLGGGHTDDKPPENPKPKP
ncbi:peptidoglycan-binding protein [Nostoc sp. DedQUE09]|uniref:peptidoglycan-binding protein n=1 Tax=Nostoc sp. DedQUE09 TaxID=3075394 RepID=UPI002AD33DC0|nr:peptidoglycan-binding protein [Nostoc sp. DedQUE09]MDZ7953117.1 peptidoglycan-binding protein [Nostoc sp. DedQUE09]